MAAAPSTLYRVDDGQPFDRKSDGRYYLRSSTVHKTFGYGYTELMGTDRFSVRRPDRAPQSHTPRGEGCGEDE